MPDDMPARAPSAVGQWHVAPVVGELAGLTVESRLAESKVSVLALGIETR